PHKVPEDVTSLIQLIISEVQSPADMQQVLDRMPAVTNCAAEAMQFLKAKDRAQRREAYIKTEPRWYGKYGWFMARIVILFGGLVLIFSLLSRGAGVDFVTALILGAAGYYLLLVTLSNIRYRDKNRKRLRLLQREAENYQREIVAIASALLKRYRIDPGRFPIANPKIKAGLDELETGFYFPAERES
ncbi:MAG TPA: hypothetical protein VNO70_12015, partial [Blastocatellia bacterium]|nr:hypothetical protein [Blastocatellia bacterium]